MKRQLRNTNQAGVKIVEIVITMDQLPISPMVKLHHIPLLKKMSKLKLMLNMNQDGHIIVEIHTTMDLLLIGLMVKHLHTV